MIDTMTNERVTVTTFKLGGAYICLPLAQLGQVTLMLDVRKIPYWVDEESLSIDGKPEIIWINLMEGADPAKVQELLDSNP